MYVVFFTFRDVFFHCKTSVSLQSRDEELLKSQIEAEDKESEQRRSQFENAMKDEKMSKKKEKEALIDDLVFSFHSLTSKTSSTNCKICWC